MRVRRTHSRIWSACALQAQYAPLLVELRGCGLLPPGASVRDGSVRAKWLKKGARLRVKLSY